MINQLKDKNPHLVINHISSCAFSPYGKIVKDYDLSSLIAYAENNFTIPTEGVKYEPSIPQLERLPAALEIEEQFFGGMPTQFGFTNGKSLSMDALEWHKSSELVIAVTDLVIIVGRVQDIGEVYPSQKAEIFYVPHNTAFELYATTLHYAPCSVDENGYKSIVVLPRNTNTTIPYNRADKYLWARNKWLIAHPSVSSLIREGANCVILGENITISI